MEKEMENKGANTNNGVDKEEKGKMKEKAFEKIQRGWHRFSTSKGGRWAIRVGKAGLIGLGLYEAYDLGKKSVKPELVYVTPAEPEPAQETEEPETKPVEQTENE